jgi:hypothetical protein
MKMVLGSCFDLIRLGLGACGVFHAGNRDFVVRLLDGIQGFCALRPSAAKAILLA